ncbi:MAG: type III pantothenate kinase [Muribaculaceae bacterium]|nr:type III pantothenate kinase [Muribaculaceae bacterium]
MPVAEKILTLDAGNSRVKASLFEGETLVASHSVGREDMPALMELCRSYDPDGIIYCAVGHDLPEEMLRGLDALCEGHLLKMEHDTPVPVGVRYASPSTLGLDRVAAAAGASVIFPGEALLVVDAGTAVTLDVVDAAPAFRGGNISPGIYLRLKALHGYTAALPMVEPDGDTPPFGYDTVTAIRSGVMRGLGDEIAASFRRAQGEYGVSRLVISGGDAPLLLPLIDSIKDEVVFVPDLVARGLLAIYNYNAS